MKKIIYSLLAAVSVSFTSCVNLDLMPPADPAQETWYQNEEQFDMACKDLYRGAIWYWEANRLGHTDRFTDDWMHRDHAYEWIIGQIDGKTGYVKTMWTNTYKGITRANDIINNCELRRGVINESLINRFQGEAYMFRACFYSYLIFLYGDVPYYTEKQSIESAYQLGRVDKWEILEKIYEDFDKAYNLLPESSEGNRVRVFKATAMAFKARTAMWMGDYKTAKEAAETVIGLKKYMLDSDFERIHLQSCTQSPEYIFMIPRSIELGNTDIAPASFLPRNKAAGYTTGKVGTATAQPSFEAFLSFLCTDGKTVAESPLYNPTKPWENRDPRCGMTIVLPGSTHLNVEYDPGKEKVKDYSQGGVEIKNNDSRIVNVNAAWNGLLLRKGVNDRWYFDSSAVDPPCIVYRYADLLLMYAEAKIELGECDDSVRDAINQVRARAYKCGVGEITKYPSVTETDQAKLRTIVRMERRMELMWENRRWFDLIRWRIFHKINGTKRYGFTNKAATMKKMIANGDYFFPKGSKPGIDEDGIIDMLPIIEAGGGVGNYFIVGIENVFPEDGHQYLLPLPSDDVVNVFKYNNPGY